MKLLSSLLALALVWGVAVWLWLDLRGDSFSETAGVVIQNTADPTPQGGPLARVPEPESVLVDPDPDDALAVATTQGMQDVLAVARQGSRQLVTDVEAARLAFEQAERERAEREAAPPQPLPVQPAPVQPVPVQPAPIQGGPPGPCWEWDDDDGWEYDCDDDDDDDDD